MVPQLEREIELLEKLEERDKQARQRMVNKIKKGEVAMRAQYPRPEPRCTAVDGASPGRHRRCRNPSSSSIGFDQTQLVEILTG